MRSRNRTIFAAIVLSVLMIPAFAFAERGGGRYHGNGSKGSYDRGHRYHERDNWSRGHYSHHHHGHHKHHDNGHFSLSFGFGSTYYAPSYAVYTRAYYYDYPPAPAVVYYPARAYYYDTGCYPRPSYGTSVRFYYGH